MRATSTSFPSRATPPIPSSGRATRSSCRRPARSSASSWRWASPTPCARRPTAGGLYTFWDYQAGAWQKNNGIRIDHLLLSPQAADRLKSVEIDKAMRGRDKASDHTPIRMELAA